MLNHGCDCGLCFFNTPEARIVKKKNMVDQKNWLQLKVWFFGRVSAINILFYLRWASIQYGTYSVNPTHTPKMSIELISKLHHVSLIFNTVSTNSQRHSSKMDRLSATPPKCNKLQDLISERNSIY